LFHIYAVSDGTGTTAERVVRASLVQFDDHQVQITRCGGVRTAAQIQDLVAQAEQMGGFIVHNPGV
jgi:regulator of PEP synthase PpsR (kinase-PPPase family)